MGDTVYCTLSSIVMLSFIVFLIYKRQHSSPQIVYHTIALRYSQNIRQFMSHWHYDKFRLQLKLCQECVQSWWRQSTKWRDCGCGVSISGVRVSVGYIVLQTCWLWDVCVGFLLLLFLQYSSIEHCVELITVVCVFTCYCLEILVKFQTHLIVTFFSGSMCCIVRVVLFMYTWI